MCSVPILHVTCISNFYSCTEEQCYRHCFIMFFSFLLITHYPFIFFFFLNDPAPPEISPFSLTDALPIYHRRLTASVQEQHSLILLEKLLADQIDHPRRGASCVDWIQQKTFVVRKQMNCFAFRFG